MEQYSDQTEEASIANDCFYLPSAMWEFIFQVAYVRARQFQLSSEDGEDCACAFLAHMLEARPVLLLRLGQEPHAERWLYRSVDNWVRNAFRHNQHIRRHEIGWSEWAPGQRRRASTALPGSATTGEAMLLTKELRARLFALTFAFPAGQRELFVRHFLREESVAEIAMTSGRRPNAIRQALWALRVRLRAALLRQDLDAAEAEDYLRLLTLPDFSWRRDEESSE